jgi:hypothetical protein
VQDEDEIGPVRGVPDEAGVRELGLDILSVSVMLPGPSTYSRNGVERGDVRWYR